MTMTVCMTSIRPLGRRQLLIGRIHGAIVAATVGAIVAATIACSVHEATVAAIVAATIAPTACGVDRPGYTPYYTSRQMMRTESGKETERNKRYEAGVIYRVRQKKLPNFEVL